MLAAIRPASPSDIADLLAIETAAFDADRISRKGFRGMIGGRSARVIVASEGAALTGYCALLFRAGSSKARLYSLAAAPGRKGVGRALLEAAEAAAAARCCSEIRLEVRADNATAIALYERYGYRQFGRKPGYYADGATALRYEKALTPAAGCAIVREP